MPKQTNDTDSSDTDFDDDQVKTEDDGILLGHSSRGVKLSTHSSFKVIQWSGVNKKTPIVKFTPHALLVGFHPEQKQQIAKYHLAFKFVKTECKLVRNLLGVHGFREVHPNSSDFNLMWTGSHLKPYTLRGMQEFQKINHFPRSYELTRKDRLYKNIQRMQHSKGRRHFDFIPDSYVLPGEFNELCAHFMKDKGPWIVKPVALSRGRGIYLVNHPNQIPLDENLLVCKYLNNPLLIDGFKLDLRLYIAVTSFDPLRIYLYEEGLTRFATVKYNKSGKYIKNSCMHLTNYSVNKKSADFVRCLDPEVEDYGTKWSMSAMLRYLKKSGRDTTSLMLRIEDLVIKTIIAGELPIASACKMFMPHPGNCFELFGFDVLVDENLRPWLLEVNLSPSLACDSPLDLKIKSHLVSDMLNIAGFVAQDPLVRKLPTRRSQMDLSQNKGTGYRKPRAQSAGAVRLSGSNRGTALARHMSQEDGLTNEEIRLLRTTKEEYNRRGGFVRIFPSPTSWEVYGSFLEHRTTNNQMLHARLFPDRMSTNQRPTTASYSSATARARTLTRYNGDVDCKLITFKADQMSSKSENGHDLAERITCYERKLDSWSPSPSQSSLSSQSGIISPETSSMTSYAYETQYPKKNFESRLAPPGCQNKVNSNTSHRGTSDVASDETRPVRQGFLNVKVPTASHEKTILHKDHETEMVDKPSAVIPKGANRFHAAKPLSAQVLHKYNSVKVDDIMDKAGYLKKLQARQAFAMYLQRVQQRLIQETSFDSGDLSRDEKDNHNQDEQMSLIIRFLKRAAANMQQPFKVVVPNQKLSLHERRRILAKQLGEFVHVYGKETAQLQKRQEIYRIYRLGRESDTEIPEEDFKVFMATASETELEEVLTQYTKLNQNSSVFLGGKPESLKSDSTPTATDTGEEIGTSVMRKRGSIDQLKSGKSSNYEGGWTKNNEDLSSTGSVSAETKERHRSATTAVSTYGSSVALNKHKQRPTSARTASVQQGDRSSRRTRPLSAKESREKFGNKDTGLSLKGQRSPALVPKRDKIIQGETKGYKLADERAVAVALQRLAKRQSARQYSALNSNSTGGQRWSELFSKMDFSNDTIDDHQKDEDFVNASNTSPQAGRYQQCLGQDRNFSANSTFDTFIGYEKRAAGDGESDSHVSVERPISSREVTQSSGRDAMAHLTGWKSLVHTDQRGRCSTAPEAGVTKKTNETSKEREKDRAREDYNKHIRMIGWKLAEQRLQQTHTSTVPRPPPKTSVTRKPMSAQRIARLAAASGISGSGTTAGNGYNNGFA